jgi:hypothetical protein
MVQRDLSSRPADKAADGATTGLPAVISALGFILAMSYPVLAVSTGARALYQLLLRHDLASYLPPLMSLVAALCYLVAAIGFVHRRRWTWRLSVVMLGFEAVMVLLVGALSLVVPDPIGRTVWRHFGADYGYFPLFQPVLGLIWLCWPETLRAYGIVASRTSHAEG